MSYTYQSFSSGQVFTSGQAQQIEDNIRDHVHGKDGVGPSGVSWNPTSRASAFSVAASDAGKNYRLSGDFQVDFAAAATLGANFGMGLTNVGSGRIVLAANPGQLIHQHSYYALTPGETVAVTSDASELEVLGAREHCRLFRFVQTVSSLAEIIVDRMYAGDFERYALITRLNNSALIIPRALVSINSGSSFFTTSTYFDTDGDGNDVRLWRVACNSKQAVLSELTFLNNVHTASMGWLAKGESIRGTGGTAVTEDFHCGTSTPVGLISAMKVMVLTNNFLAGSQVELYGIGRPRA